MKKLKSFRIITACLAVSGLLISSVQGTFPAAIPRAVTTVQADTDSSTETDSYPLKDTTADAKIATAQTAYDTAKAVYDEGSFGFFQSVGAT